MSFTKSQNVSNLGLAELRHANGVSLKEIADLTRIGPVFLRAIENEEFSLLPGGIFDYSFIRQYASAAKIDDAPLLAAYGRYRAEKDGPPSQSQHDSGRRGGAFRWLFSLVASLFVASSPPRF